MDWGTIALTLILVLILGFAVDLLRRWTKRVGLTDTSVASDSPEYAEHHHGGSWGPDNGSGGHHDGGGGGHH